MKNILIVDDDSDMQTVLSDTLQLEGYKISVAGDGNTALKEIRNDSPELILLDVRLPGMNGLQLLKKIKQINKKVVVIILTSHGDIKDAVSAIKLGAFDYVTKPFKDKDIIAYVKNALESHSAGSGDTLSMREKEVLKWLKIGKSSWDISIILGISERTVNFHVTNIMSKLDAMTRTQAVAISIEKGLI
ncbi:MAG TPA: response regulator [Nitrospirae bacterium]|nr:response regulator protein TmoT [bacterium BMS3Abin09]GBE41689.1 response regulator protein TmoT [bacterium BMS3Bbin09]HDZ84526.1 response regulator [Nitrospirota bacterium]